MLDRFAFDSMLGHLLSQTGCDEAMRIMARARELDPSALDYAMSSQVAFHEYATALDPRAAQSDRSDFCRPR